MSIKNKIPLLVFSLISSMILATNTLADSIDEAVVDRLLTAQLLNKKQQLGNSVFIRIFKEEKEFEIWMRKDPSSPYEKFRTYKICNYSGALGPKFREGDNQAPEGFYRIYKQSLNPNSAYYRSFNLGYPNKFDRANNRTGSYLMVHGGCLSIGCYAMTDIQMGQIYKLVSASLNNSQEFIRVHAFPFRMTKKRMQQAIHSKHYPFWLQLKTGYDYFEKTKIPPTIDVQNDEYVIQSHKYYN